MPGRGPILAVSDDEETRELISDICRRAGYPISVVSTGREALTSCRRTRPALVLLDLELPDMTGYEACVELRERCGEHLLVIFLSANRTESSDRVAGLLLGADDYVIKPFDPDELLARVRVLLARTADLHPAAEASLTKRETEVLLLLAEGLGQEEIAEVLFISPKTVSTHIQRILPKLGVHSRTEAVARAYRDGLIPLNS
jgi:DNA-binding NarL/FixJ family response regulator